jgi:hypothetical protein
VRRRPGIRACGSSGKSKLGSGGRSLNVWQKNCAKDSVPYRPDNPAGAPEPSTTSAESGTGEKNDAAQRGEPSWRQSFEGAGSSLMSTKRTPPRKRRTFRQCPSLRSEIKGHFSPMSSATKSLCEASPFSTFFFSFFHYLCGVNGLVAERSLPPVLGSLTSRATQSTFICSSPGLIEKWIRSP